MDMMLLSALEAYILLYAIRLVEMERYVDKFSSLGEHFCFLACRRFLGALDVGLSAPDLLYALSLTGLTNYCHGSYYFSDDLLSHFLNNGRFPAYLLFSVRVAAQALTASCLMFCCGWAYAFHQDRASSVRVPVANVTLFSLVHLLQENTHSVRGPVGPMFLLGLLVLAIVAACASKAVVTLSATSFLMTNTPESWLVLQMLTSFWEAFYQHKTNT
ncbi:hypothetical protein Tco_1087541 [Tanacetum coccineum]